MSDRLFASLTNSLTRKNIGGTMYIKAALVLLVLPALPVSASAQQVFLEYVGNTFNQVVVNGPTPPHDQYTTSDRVTASFELPGPLAPNLVQEPVTPISFTTTDGINTFSDSSPLTSQVFLIWTDASGAVTQWWNVRQIHAPVVGGGTQETIFSVYAPSISAAALDFGAFTACGPASNQFGCAFFGDPFYSVLGQVGDNPGSWSYRFSGRDAFSSGYWRNWNECTGGGQAATAQANGGAAEGYFLVEDVIPQTLGAFQVNDCPTAVAILSRRDAVTDRNRASDGAYQLATQLLAYKFNIASGADTCVAAASAAVDGDLLLVSIGYAAAGAYLPPKGDGALRIQAAYLASVLDEYNNGTLCTP